MDALRLLFEGWLALSTISFFVCACLADDRDDGTLPGRSTINVSIEAMRLSAVNHF